MWASAHSIGLGSGPGVGAAVDKQVEVVEEQAKPSSQQGFSELQGWPLSKQDGSRGHSAEVVQISSPPSQVKGPVHVGLLAAQHSALTGEEEKRNKLTRRIKKARVVRMLLVKAG